MRRAVFAAERIRVASTGEHPRRRAGAAAEELAMPHLVDAISYVDDASRSNHELERACAILLLPTAGPPDVLRQRLRHHLTTLDAERPVVCLHPGPATPRAGGGLALPRPNAEEYAPVFADEIALVPDDDDFADMLAAQLDITRALAATFDEAHASLRYAPGKWTVRQTIGHLSDCERVLSYRLLRALRGDAVVLPGFDHVGYVDAGRFEGRELASVMDECAAVRAATVALIRSAPASAFAFRLRVGQGSITGTALAYLMAGHERHHQALLRTRYLPLLPALSASASFSTT
ncbi:MAG: DinB family protein [Gemmatimonadaceae bacterium]